MTRRRRKQPDAIGEFVTGILALAGFYLFITFRNYPFLSSATCGLLIVVLLLSGLWLWQRRRQRQLELALTDQLLELTPKQFEYAVAELFRSKGFKAEVTGGSNDSGVDIRLRQGDKRAVVQCKRYSKNITPAQIREFAGAIGEAKVSTGFFVTTSGFSRMASEAANNSNVTIKLIDGQALGRIQSELTNQLNKNPRSAFIPLRWWQTLPNWQKGMLTVAFSATLWGIVTVLVYMIGLNVLV